MPTHSHAANGSRRAKTTARLRACGRPCWICKLPIDYTLAHTDPEAFNADELVPRKFGGSPYDSANVEAAHACCNNWRRTKSVEYVQALQARLVSLASYNTATEFVKQAKAYERATKAGKKPLITSIKHTTAW